MRSSNSKAKPEVRIVELNDKTFRFVNICAAARWAGVSQQTFADVLRRHLRNRKTVVRPTPKERILAAYPELFA